MSKDKVRGYGKMVKEYDKKEIEMEIDWIKSNFSSREPTEGDILNIAKGIIDLKCYIRDKERQIYRPKGSKVMKGEASVARDYIHMSNRPTSGGAIMAHREKGTLIWIPDKK